MRTRRIAWIYAYKVRNMETNVCVCSADNKPKELRIVSCNFSVNSQVPTLLVNDNQARFVSAYGLMYEIDFPAFVQSCMVQLVS